MYSDIPSYRYLPSTLRCLISFPHHFGMKTRKDDLQAKQRAHCLKCLRILLQFSLREMERGDPDSLLYVFTHVYFKMRVDIQWKRKGN